MEGLVEGAILAILVVLLFLRDIRATAISALAIPLSAIPSFFFMDLLGVTLNGLSLLAMSLLQESSSTTRSSRSKTSSDTCVWENPPTRLRSMPPTKLVLRFSQRTMSIVAVFLPVALMPGITGQFFKAFGFTVVISVLMSLLVARMITPLVAAYFLRSHGAQPHAAWK